MMTKSLWVLLWFPITFVLVVINLGMLMTYQKTPNFSAEAPMKTNFQLTAAGGTSQVLSATIESGDARVLLVESFLNKHNSPMSPYAGNIVWEADRFGIDFRLAPSIAMCESGAGKRMPKKTEFNAFGIAVYTGQVKGKAFTSWPHAISWVSQYPKERYYDRGITDLRAIGEIWAPPSVNTGYSWTNCVESFMNSIL